MARISDEDYLTQRVEDQLQYFEANATRNQRKYRFLKKTAIICNVLTTLAIALAFTAPENAKVLMGIGALVLSTTVLATYQWEEFQNYGAKWEKFRLVAEQLKSEKFLYLNESARYDIKDQTVRHKLLVETIESIIKGTDLSYFSLMVEPGKRIEKRLQSLSTE